MSENETPDEGALRLCEEVDAAIAAHLEMTAREHDLAAHVRRLVEENKRLQTRVDQTTCCETCDEWDDESKEPPSWVVCWKCSNKNGARRNALAAELAAERAKVEKLREYAAHKPSCRVMFPFNDDPYDDTPHPGCTCGLVAVLAEADPCQ